MALKTSAKNREIFQKVADFVSGTVNGAFNTKELREEFDRLKIREDYNKVFMFLDALKRRDYIYPVGREQGRINYQRAKDDDGNWKAIILTEIIH